MGKIPQKLICSVLLICMISIAACSPNPTKSDNSGISGNSDIHGTSSESSVNNSSNPGAKPTATLTVAPSITAPQSKTPTEPVKEPVVKEVEIPSDLSFPNPANFSDVTTDMKNRWMPYLTLFPDATECKMLIYSDPAKDTGFLIAMNTASADYQLEILKMTKESDGNESELVPVKNTAKSVIPLTQQFRIVSPRMPLLKAQVNDTSKLKTFDVTPFASPGKSPYRMRAVCIEPFMAMLDQSKTDGIISTTVRDIYRSYSLQELFFQSKIKEYQNTGLGYNAARIKAEKEVAAPGTSEHHDGFTADVTTYKVDMVQKTGLSPLGNWLKDNCWDYGFIIRYLKGKEEQTTKIYEPWHVRYLGLPTSLLFKKHGIVLDEFHAYLAKKQYIITSFPGFKDETDGNETDETEPAYIYVRCKSAGDIMIPQDMINSSSTLLSEVGDGHVVLMQKMN